MGTITSGVGLISGLNIDDIVTKLMAIERQPVNELQARVKTADAQRTAIQTLSATVLAIKASLAPLKSNLLFQSSKATSSNQDFVQASASSGATPGTQRIRVQQLATAQQLVSRGVSDPAHTPLGAGTVVFASALSKLTQDTDLAFLNGQQGVKGGTIQIADGSGASAKIDLSSAKTVRDVVDAINAASGIKVQAQVQGDRLAIVDLSGQQTSQLSVTDVNGGHTAQDLGIAGTGTIHQIQGADVNEILGADVNRINESTSLSLLNDGNGIGTSGTDDMQITSADGTSFKVNLSDTFGATTNLSMLNSGLGVRLGTVKITHADGTISQVDLSGAKTAGDVLTTLSKNGNLSVAIVNNQLNVVDNTKGTGKMTIEDASGHAAADLGIAATSTGTDATQPQSIRGKTVYQVRTVGDVLRAINNATGNNGAVTASVDAAGKGIVLTDNTTGSSQFAVQAWGTSTAATDLGLTGSSVNGKIAGQRLIATMNSTLLRSLNGGQGIGQLGQVKITDRAGNTSTFDLSGAQTIDDVLSMLQPETGGAKVQAQLSDSGLGIVLKDTSTGAGDLVVEDVTGTAAQGLKIAGQTTGDTLRGGALYRQYVSGNTLLSDMDSGKGVAAGNFTITDSAGNKATINVSSSGTARLQDVISLINAQGSKAKVQARINDSGDGIVIIDKAGGAGQMKIVDNSSTTAADLRIAGTTQAGQDRIDGRASASVTLDASSSLNDLVGDLGSMSGLFSASLINDGSSVSPYHLMITATNSGSRGALAIDTGGITLGLDTLVQAQDAIAYIGGNGQTGGVQVISSDNQLRDVIPNVTLTLTGQGGYSDIAVSQDVDALSKQISSVADKINATFTQLSTFTQYSDTASQRGPLFGDFAADELQSDLYNMLSQRVNVNGRRLSLSDLGFQVSSSGVTFDDQAFQSAFKADPAGITQAFTDSKSGLWVGLDKAMQNLTDPTYGLLPNEDQSLQKQEDLYNQRITDLNAILDSKQARLYSQYQAMETALSQLQGQQAALASLTSLTTTSSSSNKTSNA